VYARVSTTRQAQAQTIEQQLDRLRSAVAGRGWELQDEHVYRDDGYSGAGLGRPGLDRLRDHAALADLDVVLVTAADRLARNYVHQVLLIEELAGATATTCAAGAPTRCARRRGGAAPPATSLPGSSTSWSGPTCARC
jgi:site-specific DNA recombinase